MNYSNKQLKALKKSTEARKEWARVAKAAEIAAAVALAQSGNTATELDAEAHRLWLEVPKAAKVYEDLAKITARLFS